MIIDWIVAVFLIVGILAFMAQALLKLVSTDYSPLKGTPAWKWKNILSIVAGFCLFGLLGLISLWRFFEKKDNTGFIVGICMLCASFLVIWISINELLQLNSSPRWANYLLLSSGILLILWMGYDLLFHYQESGLLFSFENLVLLGVGLYATLSGMRRVRSISAQEWSS